MDRVSSIFARFEPTNSLHALSFNVIGHVLPRASVCGGGVLFDQGASKTPPLRSTLPSITRTHVAPQTPLEYLMEASLSRRKNDVSACTSRNASLISHETRVPAQPAPTEEPAKSVVCPSPTQPALKRASTCRTVPSVKTIRSVAPGAPKPKRKRIRIKTPRRREQCRTNQARYRKKQMQYAKDLEMEVKQLRQEIPVLETNHSRLTSDSKPSAWSVVVEYFHLFRSGSRYPDEISSGPKAWLQKSEAEQQLVFLRSSMTEDFMFGKLQGIEALVEQWVRYTSYFEDLQFHLEHMTKLSEEFITATASLNLTISELTLQHIFPHMLVGDGDAAVLRVKLLGLRLFLSCRLCFRWDRSIERIARIESSVEFLPSLLQVLGSIEDAAFVLEQALIAQDGTIGYGH